MALLCDKLSVYRLGGARVDKCTVCCTFVHHSEELGSEAGSRVSTLQTDEKFIKILIGFDSN